jgi:tetraacyldisaccharide 4'-kinase
VGDEPILLSGAARTIVSRDRPAGARLAHETGSTVVIMDDGLQNPSLIKDCAIAVVDGATGIGNGLPLPAGPLRADMEMQWPRIDAVLIIGKGEPGRLIAEEAERRNKRVFDARLKPSGDSAKSLKGMKVLAFAGIGRPEKFFETLRDCGAVVEAAHSFPDHHRYTAADLTALRREAAARGLQTVTTEKDFARVTAVKDAKPWPELMILPVRLQVANETGLRNLLLRRINERRLQVA